MSDQCPLCERRKDTGSDYCVFHNVALANLDNAHSAWREAFGEITKTEYFTKVEALPETGKAVKDIIRHLREKGAVP